MALFMITLHNKGVLTGGKNTLITAGQGRWWSCGPWKEKNQGKTRKSLWKPWEHGDLVGFNGDLSLAFNGVDGKPYENHRKMVI